MERFYKLNEIENLKGTREDLVIDFILLLYSECLLENFGFGPKGNDFYWAIKDYVSSNCLPATLKLKEEKVTELLPIVRSVPKFNARSGEFLNENDLTAFLENTKWAYDSKTNMNHFEIGGNSYSWKSAFLKIVIQDGVPFCASYCDNGEDGCAFVIKGEREDKLIEKVKDYPFSTKKIPLSENGNRVLLTDEEFFKVEDLSRLAQEQKDAVRSDTKTNTLILAGAGSGKTRCIVARVAYLNLVKGIPLNKIALITFTRNTAFALREKVRKLYDNISLAVGISLSSEELSPQTIDSFVYKLAQLHYKELYMDTKPRFDQDVGTNQVILNLCDKIITQQGTRDSVYAHYYSNNSLSPYIVSDLSKFFNGMPVNVAGIDSLAAAYLNYEIDHATFADFSSLTYLFQSVLAEDGEELKKIIADEYKAILIDEFQDVSFAQNKVFEPFYNGDIHFTFVGDDDQTIYGWRGSDIEVINRVRKLPNCRQYNLMTNYRCNASIVKAGNAILRIIENRAKTEEPRALDDSPTPISVATYDSKYSQLLPEIDKLVKAGVTFSEILILVRTNDEGREVSDALLAHGTPTILNDDEVKLNEMYWLFNALCNMTLGEKPIIYAARIKEAFDLSGPEHTERRIDGLVHGKLVADGVMESGLAEISKSLRDPNDKTFLDVCIRFQDTFQRFVTKVCQRKPSSPLRRFISSECGDVFEALQKTAKNSRMPWPTSSDNLKAFFKTFEGKSTVNAKKVNRPTEGIRIYTFHSAKGLEADYVFILGTGMGMLPNTSGIDRQRMLLKNQLFYINQSREKLKNLKEEMLQGVVYDALRECDFNGSDATSMDWLRQFKKRISALSSDIIKLSPRGVSGYNDNYIRYISAIERKQDADIDKLNKECGRKIDELATLMNKDALSPSPTNNSALYGQLKNEIKELKKRLGEATSAKEAFHIGSKSIRSLYTTCSLAEAYYSDLEKEKSIDEINNLLDKTEEQLKNEERRVFYVAVTRAGKKLYLLRPYDTEESEFIRLIPDELLERKELLSYSEIEDCQRQIDQTKEKAMALEGKEEEEEKELVIHVSDSKIGNKLNAFLDAFYESHPKCRLLPTDARLYFESAVKWDCLGKICSHEGSEYIVAACLNKAAKHLLIEKCFKDQVESIGISKGDLKTLYGKITSLPLQFSAPGEKTVEQSFAPHSFKDNVVTVAVALFASSDEDLTSVSPKDSVYAPIGGKESTRRIVASCLDLSGAQTQIIYKDETEWKERMLGLVFRLFFDIVKEIL